MAEGHNRNAWNHTASIMALNANLNRTSKSKEYKPEDFHPMHAKKSAQVMPGTIQDLRLFLGPDKAKAAGS